MDWHLSVRKHFDGHEPGDLITDPAEIAAILAGEHEHDVVRVTPATDAPHEGA